MALAMDQHQSNFKHFCKICKKGFGCGRALGGHMRTHGIGDDGWNLNDDEDAAIDWEEKHGGGCGGGNESSGTKRKYDLRTNPNRSKNVRVCESCGKEFSSWDSFFEHGKCSSSGYGHVGSSKVSSPPISDGDGERAYGWTKRKRSFRADVGTLYPDLSSEDIELANYLIMLSKGQTDAEIAVVVAASASAEEPGESSASASRVEERRSPINLITPVSYYVPAAVDHKGKSPMVPKGLFECKACKKLFTSHQALGGHRASHKKVKGCFASRQDQLEDKDDDVVITHHEEYLPTTISNSNMAHHHSNNNASPLLVASSSSSKRNPKVHECSICQRTFSSGQALGGHKRCHWITPSAPDSSTLARFQQFQDHMERMNQIPKFDNSSSETLDLKIDLNLPAPADDPVQPDLKTEIFLGGMTTKEKDNSDSTNSSQCRSLGKRKLHHHETENDNKEEDKNKNNNSTTVSIENAEDESDDGRVKKLPKLTELKDMNIGESSSPWL